MVRLNALLITATGLLASAIAIPGHAQQIAPSATQQSISSGEITSEEEFSANWGLAAIGAEKALEKGFTGEGVRVGVVDGSIQLSHPEFAGRADLFQFDDVDDDDHGTHVAGIIGAGQNNIGMQGVAPETHLSAIRVFVANTSWISDEHTAEGIDAALSSGIRIFNNSWGTDDDIIKYDRQQLEKDMSPTLMKSFQNAVDFDAILVWANGNSSTKNSTLLPGMPYYFPELKSHWIAVASVERDFKLSEFSSACGVAATWCISAPGGDIYSSVTMGSMGTGVDYDTYSGTSMAAPHVTGTVAVAREIFPKASGSQLAQVIFQTATDIGEAGVDEVFGWGLLNLGNIVDMIEPRTASLFATGAWSRFATLQHVASAIQRGGSPPPSGSAQSIKLAELQALADQNPTQQASSSQQGAQRRFWMNSLYGTSKLSAASANPGANSETAGLVLGLDLVTSDTKRWGIAASYSKTVVEVPAGRAEADGYHVLTYGNWQDGRWFSDVTGQLAYFDQQLTRANISGAADTSLTPVGYSSPSTWAGELDGRLGHIWTSGGFELAPYFASRFRWQQTGRFNEKGANIFSLSVPKTSLTQFEIGPGIRITPPPSQLGQYSACASFDFGYANLMGDRRHMTNVELLGTRIAGSTADIGQNLYKVGTEIKFARKEGRVFGLLAYHGQFQSNASSHVLSLSLHYAF